MSFTVVYSDVALEALRHMEQTLARRVMRCTDELEVDPYPHGVEPVMSPLAEEPEEHETHVRQNPEDGGLYRIRCQGYRIVFEVDAAAQVVLVWVIQPPLTEAALRHVLGQLGDEEVIRLLKLQRGEDPRPSRRGIK